MRQITYYYTLFWHHNFLASDMLFSYFRIVAYFRKYQPYNMSLKHETRRHHSEVILAWWYLIILLTTRLFVKRCVCSLTPRKTSKLRINYCPLEQVNSHQKGPSNAENSFHVMTSSWSYIMSHIWLTHYTIIAISLDGGVPWNNGNDVGTP